MGKPFYAEYVNHMLRFYARTLLDGTFTDELLAKKIEKENWRSVEKALDGLAEWERDQVIELYGRRDTLGDNVYALSHELHIEQDTLWRLVSKVTCAIAKERGLI